MGYAKAQLQGIEAKMIKRCQMVNKLYGEIELCPNPAKHSIVYRTKRETEAYWRTRTCRLCDQHFYEAKSRNEFFGDTNPEFREGRIDEPRVTSDTI